MIGVGIIGAGWWAGEHARAVAALPDLRLVACASRSAERRAAFASTYGCAGYEDYRALLADRAIDAVAIATSHDSHAAIAMDALGAGKHVLLEKPLARDRQECALVAAAARQASTIFLVGLTHHFTPLVAEARALAARGEIGAVVAAFCAYSQPWRGEQRPRFYRERALGGGVWLTLGVHFVDRLLWLIDSEVVAVKAVLGQRFHPPDEQQADDMATVLLHFASGATGTIVVAGYRDGAPWLTMQLLGERGALRLDGDGLALGHNNAWQPVAVAATNPMEVEWAAFARSITDGTPPPIPLDYALRVMDIVFAAEESAASGREKLLGG
ncbi:MAG: Gfo/Idh/MocA family protein [Thermomicrobiales bacterium]